MSTALAGPGLDGFAAPNRAAVDALQAGEPVLAVDDLDGTGCDLIVLAPSADVPAIAEMVRSGSGFVCVTVDDDRARRLELPPMTWPPGEEGFGGCMCVSVDAVAGTTTGISARDRATTIRALADPTSEPGTFTRPGHVVPVLAGVESTSRIGILARAGLLSEEARGDAEMVPVAFASLISQRDPLRAAAPEEAGDWGLPILRYSDLLSVGG
ncbi:3,4-dihydroxy-2-butanone-4-phosphate synthase [Gordonia soli]|uniref:3,4-dihydroxy-2-butanone-4-phosphate synthase n=1 Tax=Gordonia soli NBRC 108243 TaxID=1223545 RepID=M0QFL5_9ACTN|nr:3,4-dihydroxy-2-butanone-4-phosphate synthase [Gordonia soli]GAC67385.1 3,4-dihydroxy-2-butanone 4-phosphate synthase [Gordonia soli NBRC 108243]